MIFSANLGFLWTDRPLPAAIRAAAAAGFAVVECHAPFDTPAAEAQAVLAETGLAMLALNTRRGQAAQGENGLAALPGRSGEARAAVREALEYAGRVGARAVHVMAGNAAGPAAEEAFLETLRFATDAAGERGLTVLIEPLNRHDAPGYFLRSTDQAMALVERVGQPNLALMFDCYHVARSEGDVTTRLRALIGRIGHVQIASVPDRGPPDAGEIDYRHILATLAGLGWDRPVGAEFRPRGGPGVACSALTALRPRSPDDPLPADRTNRPA